MPKEQFIILSNCRIDGQHVEEGTTIDLDPKVPREAEKIGLLHLAGRIAPWTKKNYDYVQDQIKKRKAEQDRIIADRTKAANSTEELVRRLVKLLIPSTA